MNLKQKNIALFLGFIFSLWIAHLLSFSKTLELKKQHGTLKEEALLFENGAQKLLQLKQENHYYDSIFKSKKISTSRSFQNNLLSVINSFADSAMIKVVSFENPHKFQQEGSEVLTYAFTVQGNFNQITRLIYQLEQRYKLGKIISINYVKKRNYRKRLEYLECDVLLQQVSQE